MSGEVVTFATAFEPDSCVFPGHRALGPFEVSASRDCVTVHRAALDSDEDLAAFTEAIEHACAAWEALQTTWHGGAPSLFPEEPTPCRPEAHREAVQS